MSLQGPRRPIPNTAGPVRFAATLAVAKAEGGADSPLAMLAQGQAEGGADSPLPQAAFEDIDAAFEDIDVWARRNWWGGFSLRVIEVAYQRFMSRLWVDHFQLWTILAASIFSIAPILMILDSANTGRMDVVEFEPHFFMQTALNAVCCFYWSTAAVVALLHRYAGRERMECISQHQQAIIASIAFVTIFAVSLPILVAAPHDIVALHGRAYLSDVLGTINYVEGMWHTSVAASGAVMLACSGIEPVTFSICANVGFVLWTLRNRKLRLALVRAAEQSVVNATAAMVATNASATTAIAANANASVALSEAAGVRCHYRDSSIAEQNTTSHVVINLLPVFLVCLLICCQRDSMARQNFVILQLVKVQTSKVVGELRGEKKRLEMMLAVDRAQSEAHQHIKFVVARTPRRNHKGGARTTAGRLPLRQAPAGNAPDVAVDIAKPQPRRPQPRATAPPTAAPVRPRAAAAEVASPPKAAPDPAPAAAARSSAHEARLLRAVESADAARDEIGELTSLADEEIEMEILKQMDVDELDRLLSPRSESAAEARAEGRQLDIRSREHSPNLASRKLLRPTPIPGRLTSPTAAVGAAATVAEELRVDVNDGNAYTRAEFIQEYGGTRQWDAAKPMSSRLPERSALMTPPPAPTASFHCAGFGFCMPQVHQEGIRRAAAIRPPHAGLDA